ncbi:MAG: phage tail tape measure protein [Sweet potato little leaf phytoplasma]|nr:phage tail tape measure protein [Sweet potato little leaf phytoplasma]
MGDAIQKQETLNKLHDQSTKSIQQSTAAIKQMQDQAGLGDKAAQRAKELQAMTDAYTNSGGSAGDSKLQEQIAKRKEFYDAQDKMQTDFLSGAESAWNSWGESVNNVYGNVKSFAGDALNGLSTQLTDFLTTGKASFGDFAKSIIADIVNMTIKMAIFNSLSAAFGGGSTFSFAGALGGKANGGVVGNTFSGGGFTGQGGKYEPAGTVHRGEFVFTKEATQRIGVANLYRQMRGYANGGAVGQSGVSGGGSAPGVAIGIGDINVNAGGGDINAQGLSQGIRQIVTQMLVTECSQGGQIFNLIKGGA